LPVQVAKVRGLSWSWLDDAAAHAAVGGLSRPLASIGDRTEFP
jgi:hypothetical protein